MPEAASLTFTELEDNVVWFANADAFNDFLSAIKVNIAAANLPEATTTAYGAVKQAATLSFSHTAPVEDYLTISTDQDGDGVAEEYKFPTEASYKDMIAKLTALSSSYADLVKKLKDANIISS